MKKFIAFAASAILAFSAFTGSVFAANKNWTEGYWEYLNKAKQEKVSGNKVYSTFALYDIEKDGVPELFVRTDYGDYNFKIIRLSEAGKAVEEKAFYADNFYLTKDNELVVAYNNSSGTFYVKYEKNKSVSLSEQLYKTREYKETKDDKIKMIYYIGSKEVDKEEFETSFDENLTLASLNFVDMTDDNITAFAYLGMYEGGSVPMFKGSKGGSDPYAYSTVVFRDNSDAVIEKSGEKLIYGLLMVNGTTIPSIYPINEEGSTLIPVRAVSQNLKAKVEWSEPLQKVTINGENKIEMYIGDTTALVNGESVEMTIPAKIVDGSTYVPARFIAENLNTEIYFWEGTGSIPPVINIESKGQTEAVSDTDALDKVKGLFNDIAWLPEQKVFAKSFMNNNLSFAVEGLAAGRYWSVTVDASKTQRVWVDRYTGQIYTVYNTKMSYGIEMGIEAAIDAMLDTYIY